MLVTVSDDYMEVPILAGLAMFVVDNSNSHQESVAVLNLWRIALSATRKPRQERGGLSRFSVLIVCVHIVPSSIGSLSGTERRANYFVARIRSNRQS
jgi:hypothetical protein